MHYTDICECEYIIKIRYTDQIEISRHIFFMKLFYLVNRYAFSSYFFYIKNQFLKIIWSNAYLFTILKCVILSLWYIFGNICV